MKVKSSTGGTNSQVMFPLGDSAWSGNTRGTDPQAVFFQCFSLGKFMVTPEVQINAEVQQCFPKNLCQHYSYALGLYQKKVHPADSNMPHAKAQNRPVVSYKKWGDKLSNPGAKQGKSAVREHK